MGDKQSNIRYALYGRMGADCEWMLLSKRIPSYKEALEKRDYYKQTWRFVICKHYLEA